MEQESMTFILLPPNQLTILLKVSIFSSDWKADVCM